MSATKWFRVFRVYDKDLPLIKVFIPKCHYMWGLSLGVYGDDMGLDPL